MDELYTRVSKLAKQSIYQFIKNEEISLLHYYFQAFFDYYTEKNAIKVMSHHFEGRKIEGLTIIDQSGISISYEEENPVAKQNFTLCHELGHFMLEHEGVIFTDTEETRELQIEREANIYSAIILMPDIVLLSKIYYSRDTFFQVQKSLGVSREALHYRLLDLLREHFPNQVNPTRLAVEAYMAGNTHTILRYFNKIKDAIVEEYNQYHPSLIYRVDRVIEVRDFVTSRDLPELLEQDKWIDLKENIANLKTWLIYNQGKTIAYAWDSKKLSDQEARKRAELELLLM